MEQTRAAPAPSANDLIAAIETNQRETRDLEVEHRAIRNRITAKHNERDALRRQLATALGQLGRSLGLRIEVDEPGQ